MTVSQISNTYNISAPTPYPSNSVTNHAPHPTPLSNPSPTLKPHIVTLISANNTSIIYREKVEERFGKPLVEQYLHTYFSSYSTQIKQDDALIFVLLARLLRRHLNLHRISLISDNKSSEIQKNKSQLDPLEKELRELNKKGSYETAKPRLMEICRELHSIKTIRAKDITSSPKYKLYSLASDNQPIAFSLLRKITFIAITIIRLFFRIVLKQECWNEIPATGLPQTRKLLLGSLPNSLSHDAESFKKTGITAVLSVLEPFEIEKHSLSRPYSLAEWGKHGITQGWIEAKDHHPLNFEQLNIAADFIHERLKKGNVYVHCRAGASRSNMAIAAYLIKYCNYSLSQAKQCIMSHRKQSHLYKQEKLNALGLFEKYIQLVNELKNRLEKQEAPFQKDNNILLMIARLADSATVNIETTLIKTTSREYHIKITIENLCYYATVLKKSPHNICITNLEPCLPTAIDQSELNTITEKSNFQELLANAIRTYKEKKGLSLDHSSSIDHCKPLTIDLESTTENTYYVEITAGQFQYSASIEKRAPYSIHISNIESLENPSNWAQIQANSNFLLKLQTAAQSYIRSTLNRETTGRYRYTFQEEKQQPTALQLKDNPDSIAAQLKSFAAEGSAAYYLLQMLLSQTGLASITELTTILDSSEKVFLSPQNSGSEGGQFTILKKNNAIEVTTFLSPAILDPEASESTIPQGLLKVVHTMNITNIHNPTLSTKATFLPKTLF